MGERRLTVLHSHLCAGVLKVEPQGQSLVMVQPEGRTVLIAGMGPGASMGIANRFSADGYRIAMLARSRDKLNNYERTIPESRGYAVDLSDEAAVTEVVRQVHKDFGIKALDVVVYNASTGSFYNFLHKEAVAAMKTNLGNNLYGLLYVARAAAPAMVQRGSGAIIVTGNTSSRRGLGHTAAFAPTKAAQRILTESMARYLGPQGVHVGYVLIDAAIDMPFGREVVGKRMGVPATETPDHIFCSPAGIGEAVHHLAHQDKQAWTFEMDIRPFGEKF